MPILDIIRELSPDLMVMLGDNVYANADEAAELSRAYAKLGRNPKWRNLVDAVEVRAIWDDHDYGRNDAGREYPFKAISKEVMLDFFDVPAEDPRRAREGNYAAYTHGEPERRVQVILLDTRWFRDPLVRSPAAGRHYDPHTDPATTLLGEAQWRWLAETLQEEAKVRIVVSSIQVLSGEHGYESWGLFPHERERLFDVIQTAKAEGVVFVTGDRHRGEISCGITPAIPYPLFELTTSSLNLPIPDEEPNRFRAPGTRLYKHPNFGVITVRWSANPPAIDVQLRDVEGEVVEAHRQELQGLSFRAGSMRKAPCAAI